MLKKAAITIMLFKLLKLLKAKWTATDFYKDGLIDSNGEPVSDEALAIMKSRKFEYFVYGLKRILEKNAIMKYSMITFLTSMLFMRENKQYQFKIGVYNGDDNEYLKKGDIVIVDESDEYHKNNGVALVYTEHGEVVSSLRNFDTYLFEDMVTTQAVAITPVPLVTKAMKRKKKKNGGDK